MAHQPTPNTTPQFSKKGALLGLVAYVSLTIILAVFI